jgi:hypothetical protein
MRRVYLPDRPGPRGSPIIRSGRFRVIYEPRTTGTLYIFGKRAQEELKKQNP